MRADVEVAVYVLAASYDEHRKHRRAASEDIFLGISVRDVFQSAKHGARLGRTRPQAPKRGIRLAQRVSHRPSLGFGLALRRELQGKMPNALRRAAVRETSLVTVSLKVGGLHTRP